MRSVPDGPPELSPGRWAAPSGVLPGWAWTPQARGITPRLDVAPWWVRLWYSTPFVDRYAYAWMWRHGCWEIHPETG